MKGGKPNHVGEAMLLREFLSPATGCALPGRNRLCLASQVQFRVVGHFHRQPRIVILSAAKDPGLHSLYSEILRLRLRMTRWLFQCDSLRSPMKTCLMPTNLLLLLNNTR